MPHALLLSGSAGIGKTHLSQALAALLLCRDPEANVACGRCRSCHLLQAGSHGDLLQLLLEESSRVIKIEQVRSLINFANQTPGLGRCKVILLNPADALNINASNALLKCLEEPAAGTYLILVSHASSRLPATVRSRCQLLTLREPAPEQTLAWLDQFTGNNGISKALVSSLGNRPTAALELHHRDGLGQQQALQQGLDALIAGTLSAIEFPQLVAELELGEVLDLLALRLQRMIRAAVNEQPGGLRQHFLLLDELLRLQRAVTYGGNPNRQLTIETCAAQFARVVGGRA